MDRWASFGIAAMTEAPEYEALPWFTYHPDPVATGSVVESEKQCKACGRARGYIYVGPVYGREDLDEALCPWCIADGTARTQFQVEFVDPACVGGGNWDVAPREVVEEIAYRTPGFAGWQQERWFVHCADAAVFLGPAGHADLERYGAELVQAVLAESGVSESDWGSYLAGMDRNDGPVTAYVFKCRHCGALGGYADTH